MKLRSRDIGPYQTRESRKSRQTKQKKQTRQIKNYPIAIPKPDYYILKQQWELYNIFLLYCYIYLFFIVTSILYGLNVI